MIDISQYLHIVDIRSKKQIVISFRIMKNKTNFAFMSHQRQ